ncbi:MAG: GFA family protein [Acidobacteriota bacterium]|nr:GFA family protein [Acidobacteriota bacterium]
MCGGVRFEVTERPLSAGYCHCTRCQRRTGTAASAQARIAPGSFRMLAGEELVKAYRPEGGFAKCFCLECGSALWSVDPGTGEIGSVRLGLFDPGHDIRPQWHLRGLRVRLGAAPRRRPRAVRRSQAPLSPRDASGGVAGTGLRGAARPRDGR